jgi:diguanylate cyclase (GGDEF)-like protein
MQHLPREMARAERYGRSLAVLDCKIDGTARVSRQLVSAVSDETVRGFVACATSCIRKGDWLARTGKNEFMIVLPETDRRGAQCVVRKLAETFAREESAITKVPIGAAVSLNVTALDHKTDGDGAAHMQALLRKAESLRHRDNLDDKLLAEAETTNYLSDFASDSEAEKGRNWPAT